MVQDPREARYPDMPRSALEQVPMDHVTSVRRLASLLTDLVGRPVKVEATGEPIEEEVMKVKAPQWTDLTCPECRGPIRVLGQGPLKEYRCRVGHRYSPETYVAAEVETRERSLFGAILALEEAAEVMKGLAESKPTNKRRLHQAADNNLKAAKKIRELREWLTKQESRHLIEETDDQSDKEEPEEPAA